MPALLARLGARPHRITADSRQAATGVAFAAFPGAKADGRDFIADALGAGRRCRAVGAAGLQVESRVAARGAGRRRTQGQARSDRRFHLWKPFAGALGRRRHRHQWQDLVLALDRAVHEPLRPARGDHRHAGQWARRRGGAGDAHDARCRGAPGDARALQARRRACRGDGSVLARPRSGTRQRHRVRRRALHEPHPRPPRLSRHDGCVRRGEGEALRVARARGRA